MASRRFVSLLLLSYMILFSSLSNSSSAARVLSSSSQKVSLDLYYETLCPYSAKFIVNYLAKIFENGLITIIDLKLIPYGNARIGSNDTITCQHGPFECLLNTVEACAINVWPDLNKHFTFIYCVEYLVAERKYKEWESCFEKTELDSNPITDCYNSGYGKKLELQYAAETNALQPPHKYVPWVVVDGQPLYEDYENFETYVCKAYKGSVVPNACKALPLQIVPMEKENPIHQVSYAEETTTVTSDSSLSSTAATSLTHEMKMSSSI